MRKFTTIVMVLLSLVYNQVLLSAPVNKASSKKLSEVVERYNSMRNQPNSFTEFLDSEGQKAFKEVMSKANAKELPEMKLVQKGTYQLEVGKDKVIFNEENWSKRRFVVNSLLVDFSKVTSVDQLMEAISTALSSQGQTSFVGNLINSFFFQEACAIEWNLTNSLIAAAVVAALGVGGYMIYKNNWGSDKKSTPPKPAATPSSGSADTSSGEGRSCKQHVGFVWKMNKSGNTAVVVNKKFADCTIRVNGKSPNIPGGVFENDGRRYFRFKGHPKNFGPTATVEVVCNGKVEDTINIPDTSKRCSYYPGGWGD